jgi:hypothetical protein
MACSSYFHPSVLSSGIFISGSVYDGFLTNTADLATGELTYTVGISFGGII